MVTNSMYGGGVKLHTDKKIFQFDFGTRRALVSNAIGKALEAVGHGLRMGKIEKAASRMT